MSVAAFPEINLLQRILPARADTLEPPLYERIAGNVQTFDTYFGVFPAARWRRKSAVNALHAVLEVSGPCEIEIVAVKRLKESIVLTHVAQNAGVVNLRVCDLQDTTVDSYYVSVRRTSDNGGRLVTGGWYSGAAPLREVRMNAFINTFNRQPSVLANGSRMRQLLTQVPSI